MSLVWLSLFLPLASAGPDEGSVPSGSAAPPVERPSDWDVPVRFAVVEPAFDRSRGVPLPRNTRLNPTLRNGAIVVGVGGGVLTTLVGSLVLANLANDPFPRSDPPPRPTDGQVFF